MNTSPEGQGAKDSGHFAHIAEPPPARVLASFSQPFPLSVQRQSQGRSHKGIWAPADAERSQERSGICILLICLEDAPPRFQNLAAGAR